MNTGWLSKKVHIPPLKSSGIKRRSDFSGMKLYIKYVEFLKNRCNTVDEPSCLAIYVITRGYDEPDAPVREK